jgi:hypothetical protein
MTFSGLAAAERSTGEVVGGTERLSDDGHGEALHGA